MIDSVGDTLTISTKAPTSPPDAVDSMDTTDTMDTLDTMDTMECDDPSLLCDDSNLVMRSLKALKSRVLSLQGTAANLPLPSFHIYLEKKVPLQGGLGGGSANAATVLYGANRLLPPALRVGREVLKELSCDLGSDVTFFLEANEESGTALCEGRGEVIDGEGYSWGGCGEGGKRVEVFKLRGVGCSTPRIFGELGLEKGEEFSPRQFSPRQGGEGEGEGEDYGGNGGGSGGTFFEDGRGGKRRYENHLEGPVFKLETRIWELKQKMVESGAWDVVMMSGSGASIFAVGYKEGKGGEFVEMIRGGEYPKGCPNGVQYFDGKGIGKTGGEDGWYEKNVAI